MLVVVRIILKRYHLINKVRTYEILFPPLIFNVDFNGWRIQLFVVMSPDLPKKSTQKFGWKDKLYYLCSIKLLQE